MLNIGGAELLVVLAIMALGVIPWLWALVDALRTDDRTWQAAGQNKILWVVLIVVLGCLGALLYFFVARSSLRAVRADR